MTPDPADVEAVARIVCAAAHFGVSPDAVTGDNPGRKLLTFHNRDALDILYALIKRGWTPPNSPSSAAASPADKVGE